MPSKANDPLIEAIDKAAEGLLERISKNSDDKDTVSLTDRVKAFDAIAKWAEMKTRLAPAKRGDSKFGQLRSRLNGGAAKRGAVPAEGEEDASSPNA